MLDERRRTRRRAVHDRDLLAGHARRAQLEHLGGRELGLGKLATGLEQLDRGARVEPLGPRLEQLALEVVQGGAGSRRIVLVGGRQLEHPLGQRAELLDHLGRAAWSAERPARRSAKP